MKNILKVILAIVVLSCGEVHQKHRAKDITLNDIIETNTDALGGAELIDAIDAVKISVSEKRRLISTVLYL